MFVYQVEEGETGMSLGKWGQHEVDPCQDHPALSHLPTVRRSR